MVVSVSWGDCITCHQLPCRICFATQPAVPHAVAGTARSPQTGRRKSESESQPPGLLGTFEPQSTSPPPPGHICPPWGEGPPLSSGQKRRETEKRYGWLRNQPGSNEDVPRGLLEMNSSHHPRGRIHPCLGSFAQVSVVESMFPRGGDPWPDKETVGFTADKGRERETLDFRLLM